MIIDKLYIVIEMNEYLIDWNKEIEIPRIGEQIMMDDYPLKVVTMVRYSVVNTMMEIKIFTSNA